MSLSFGSSKKKSSSQTQPWAPTIPYLEDYLGQVGGLDISGEPTAGQAEAVGQLESIYGAGSPWAGTVSDLATETAAGIPSRAGDVTGAYDVLKTQLTPYASGEMLDFANNPYVQDMLAKAGSDAMKSVNAAYAASGRDPSGAGTFPEFAAKGVAAAELPILANLYSQGMANQLAAANQLYGAGQGAATTAQGLDQAALAAKAGALPLMQFAQEQGVWGPQQLFNLEQILKEMPAQALATQGNLLLPVAGLGQQAQGTEKGTSMGLGVKLLSDERYKEDLVRIGALEDGTPIYRFRYKGEDQVRIGVSAQDLEKIAPEAVSEVEMPDGRSVKYTDTDLATRRSAAMRGGLPGSLSGGVSPGGMEYPPAPGAGSGEVRNPPTPPRPGRTSAFGPAAALLRSGAGPSPEELETLLGYAA